MSQADVNAHETVAGEFGTLPPNPGGLVHDLCAMGASYIVGVSVAVALIVFGGLVTLPIAMIFGVASAVGTARLFRSSESETTRRLANWFYVYIVVCEWLIAAAILHIQATYGESFPLSLDMFVTTGLLFTYFASPVVFVIGLISSNARTNRAVRLAVWAAGLIVAILVIRSAIDSYRFTPCGLGSEYDIRFG